MSDTTAYELAHPRGKYVDGDPSNKVACCPRCKSDVSRSLGAPAVTTMRLHGHGPKRIAGDTVNVRGYVCHDCRRVLPLPVDAIETHAPGSRSTGWVRLGAFLGSTPGTVAVPASQVVK